VRNFCLSARVIDDAKTAGTFGQLFSCLIRITSITLSVCYSFASFDEKWWNRSQ